MTTATKYEPFPNMTSRELRMILGWAVSYGAQEIERLETERARHLQFPASTPIAMKSDFISIDRTRAERLKEIEEWLAQYGTVYGMAKDILLRLKTEHIERDAEALAAWMRSQR